MKFEVPEIEITLYATEDILTASESLYTTFWKDTGIYGIYCPAELPLD